MALKKKFTNRSFKCADYVPACIVFTTCIVFSSLSLPPGQHIIRTALLSFLSPPLFHVDRSAEIGELYNQVALLLYFQNSCDEAVEHAQVSSRPTAYAEDSGALSPPHTLICSIFCRLIINPCLFALCIPFEIA